MKEPKPQGHNLLQTRASNREIADRTSNKASKKLLQPWKDLTRVFPKPAKRQAYTPP